MKNRDWVKLYLNHLVNENYEDQLALKSEHFPSCFFKYRPLNCYTIKNIKESTIHLSDLDSLNDPFESSMQFDNDECLRIYLTDTETLKKLKDISGVEFSCEELIKIILSKQPYPTYLEICKSKNIDLDMGAEEQINKAQMRWVEILEKEMKNLKVCCFSEVNDSLLMWSHYADEHKGICIEYDMIDHNEIRAFLQPISYSEGIYKIDIFEDLTMHRLIRASLTKCKDWEYEAEWRLTIIKRKNQITPENMNAPRPKAIYLGTRFNQNKKELITDLREALKNQGIPIYQMQKHSTEYKLEKRNETIIL